jgi:hypothetical protein
MKSTFKVVVAWVAFMFSCTGWAATTAAIARAGADGPLQISGIYPHLAMFNSSGECGTGAVVPWAGRLWVITYAPHEAHGSDDKLYEIDPELRRIARPESVGGTPADRLIHRESGQLIIGPYLIDAEGHVRVIPYSAMPGRLTAVARHLTDPANRVYIYDMEGTLYEVDVHTLAVKRLFARVAPGAHGKGAYTGQGHLIVANNGEVIVNKAAPAAGAPPDVQDPEAAGALAQWDGKTWQLLARREFTDVTGPGGIEGAPSADAPVWTIGWDRRSVILKTLDGGQWHDFRLPIADYSYVARHGWYTEWPRIRQVDGGKYLMNMHGQWFDFPAALSSGNTAGLQPLGCYLKITGDFAAWQNHIVFGCDHASLLGNPLLGQSQSNLWFSTWQGLSDCGAPAGFGGPWMLDTLAAGEVSTPYLFAGYRQRIVHLSHHDDHAVSFAIELDADGHGDWKPYTTITVPAHGYSWHIFPESVHAQWVRLKVDRACPQATAYFHYGPGGGANTNVELFQSLADAGASAKVAGGQLRALGENRGTLLFDAAIEGSGGNVRPVRLEVGPDMQFHPYAGQAPAEPQSQGAAAPFQVTRDAASLILTQGTKRFRLPVFDSACDEAGAGQRTIREVVTERLIVNAAGTFFMLPRESAGGAERIKPVSSHHKVISDFCSWRGLLVLAGHRQGAAADGHYFASADGTAGLWFGDIDDLWKLGKPAGSGGPWRDTPVNAGEPSDPYLMTGYDAKSIDLSDDATTDVQFTVEVDPDYTGWKIYQTFTVAAGKTLTHQFPAGFAAHWVRVRADRACRASAILHYQ